MFPIATGVVDPRSPGGRPASWAATGRSGGVSADPYASLNLAGYVGDADTSVAENRRRLAGALGLPGERLVVMDSVHGAEVSERSSATGPDITKTNAASATSIDESASLLIFDLLLLDCRR